MGGFAFIELTLNGKKDSAGRSVIAFSSTIEDKPDFSIGSHDTFDFYFWKDILGKSIGGTFEIMAKTPDQRILRMEFGNSYVSKERVHYNLELSDSTIVRVK